MFDDVKANYLKLHENGINCYLVATKYNLNNTDGFQVVKNWQEIYQVINDLEVIQK